MNRHTDEEWTAVLIHRRPAEIPSVADRFERYGISPTDVSEALNDLGDALVPDPPLDAQRDDLDRRALLAAEVEVYGSYIARRASKIRAEAFHLLALGDDSLHTIAVRLGTTKQNLHRAMKRPGTLSDYMAELSKRKAL